MATAHTFEAAFVKYVKDDRGRLRLVTKHLIEEMIRIRGPARLIEALADEPPGTVVAILANMYRRPGDSADFTILNGADAPALVTEFQAVSRATML